MIIQPAELPPAFAGKEYSGGPLSSTGNVCGQQNVVWTVAKGQLPPGLDLSAAGFLSGIVNTPGEWNFTVRAQSGCGTIDHPYTLHVLASPLFDVRPGSIAMDAPMGRAGESQFSIRVGSNHAGLPYTMETSGQSWFRARARENMIPAAGRALTADLIEVTIDPSQLPPGKHKGWIKLSAWRAMAPVVIPIEARVLAPAPVASAVPITTHLEPVPIPIVREPVMTRVPPPVVVYTPPPPQPLVAPPPAAAPAVTRSPFRMRRFAAARPKLAPKPPEAKPTEKPADPHKAAEPKKPAAVEHKGTPAPEHKKPTAAEHKGAPAAEHKAPKKEDNHGQKAPEKKGPEKGAAHPPTPTVKPSPVGPPKAGQPPPKPQADAHKSDAHKPDGHKKEEKKAAAPAAQHKQAAPAPPKQAPKSKAEDAHKPAPKADAPHKGPAKATEGQKAAPKANAAHAPAPVPAPAKADNSHNATPAAKPAAAKH